MSMEVLWPRRAVRSATLIIGEGVDRGLEPSTPDKAAGLQGDGSGGRGCHQRWGERLVEALEAGVRNGLGYRKIWEMLREWRDGIKVNR